MPNVYINGLPPHFSEQDLFALTRPFGDIKSVRTFTRHVSEKPTLVFLVFVSVMVGLTFLFRVLGVMDSFCEIVLNFCMLSTHSDVRILCRFNEMESARRCIEGLRKHRNIHPSFSKVGQISTLGIFFLTFIVASSSNPWHGIRSAQCRTVNRSG